MATETASDVLTFPYVYAAEVATLATILPLLCIGAVALRFYTRTSKGYTIGLDDWLMLPGVLLYVGMCICLLIGVAHKVIGYPSGVLTNPPLERYLVPQENMFAKLFYSFQILLVVAFGFIKCSIVSLYRRIFVTEKNSKFDIICKIMYGIIIGWSVTFFVLANLSCGPKLTSYWGTKTEQSTCATFTGTRGLAGTDMVIDVALMVLPQPLIWGLRLSLGKKFAISVLIALGCACIGADIAQTILFGQIAKASELGIPLDQKEIITLVMYYTCIDGGLAVTAACLVTLRPLFRNTSVNSIVRGLKGSFGGTTLRSEDSRMNQKWHGSNSESSNGLVSGDVESGNATGAGAWKEPGKRASDSIALGGYNVKKQEFWAVGVDEMNSPMTPLAKRPSGSLALAAADRCSRCGHGH